MHSFTQINIMAVFGVKYRAAMISPSWENELYAVIGRTLNEMDGVSLIAINGVEDHIHVLFTTRGNIAEKEIIRKIKSESSLWINKKHLTRCKFAWQRGGARISYSYSAIPDVKRYISNQKIHHQRSTYLEEIKQIIEKFGWRFEERDLPEELE